jgi:hypothetical protein
VARDAGEGVQPVGPPPSGTPRPLRLEWQPSRRPAVRASPRSAPTPCR